jgi:hypothetical protein
MKAKQMQQTEYKGHGVQGERGSKAKQKKQRRVDAEKRGQCNKERGKLHATFYDIACLGIN